MNMLIELDRVSLSWGGVPGRTFLEDAMSNDTHDSSSGNLCASLVFTAKTSTLAEQVSILAAIVGIQPLIEKNPMFAMVIAVALLAAISPVDMHVLDDVAGETLDVIKKLSRKFVLDKTRVNALIKVEDGAEQAIQKLIQFGLLRQAENGDLIIQRKIISNIKVSLLN